VGCRGIDRVLGVCLREIGVTERARLKEEM